MSAEKSSIRCVQCEQIEEHCECDKYCLLCNGQLDVRLCMDGRYYCGACREACDYKIAT